MNPRLPVHDVFQVAYRHEQRSLVRLDQLVATFGESLTDVTRNGEYIFVITVCYFGSDQRAAGFRSFNNNERIAHSCDDPVARGKIMGIRFCSEVILSDQSSAVHHLPRDIEMISWINHIYTAAHHANSRQLMFQRLSVCMNID